MSDPIKAVLWDFGGVITSSPFESFNKFEVEKKIPVDFIRQINAENHETNAWAKLESSEINLNEFDRLFRLESSAKGHEISGKEVINLLSGEIRPEMVSVLKKLKENFIVGCITNNVNAGQGPGMARSKRKHDAIEEVMSNFEFIIESSKVGVRKPDPKIYKLACQRASVSPTECLYLDDLGINLKPAKAMGMRTIKVLSPDQAIVELERNLGITLA